MGDWLHNAFERFAAAARSEPTNLARRQAALDRLELELRRELGGRRFYVSKSPPADRSAVAADSKRNRIFVPQVASVAVVGSGGDTTTVGAEIYGSNNGCVAVYADDAAKDDDGND